MTHHRKTMKSVPCSCDVQRWHWSFGGPRWSQEWRSTPNSVFLNNRSKNIGLQLQRIHTCFSKVTQLQKLTKSNAKSTFVQLSHVLLVKPFDDEFTASIYSFTLIQHDAHLLTGDCRHESSLSLHIYSPKHDQWLVRQCHGRSLDSNTPIEHEWHRFLLYLHNLKLWSNMRTNSPTLSLDDKLTSWWREKKKEKRSFGHSSLLKCSENTKTVYS